MSNLSALVVSLILLTSFKIVISNRNILINFKRKSRMNMICSAVLTISAIFPPHSQSQNLTLKEQIEDFEIFKGGLNEGHSGMYNFITKKAFEKKCDSVQRTFKEGISLEDYYLKLRFLITSLKHGHDRINLPTNGWINYKMGVLDLSRLYLPFQFVILKDKLVILEDCSKEQLIPKYSIVKSINEVSSKELITKMLPYMPSDGVNQTFKTYSLYNYFYFHHLFNLFYPTKRGVKIEIEKNKTHYYVALQSPKNIDSIYSSKNDKSISQYSNPLEFRTNLPNQTGYLRVTSFYKGFIENFKQEYEPFLESSFSQLKKKGITNLIIDIRNNEGGGDNYENILFSYFNRNDFKSNQIVKVAGKSFKFNQFAINSSDVIKSYIENPQEFLQNDTTLILKNQYADQAEFSPKQNSFSGNVYILTNGGTFSAASSFVRLMYNLRSTSQRIIRFIGEENGGDVYAQEQCSGQSYVIDLPNSKIKVDMPALCFGELNTNYPKKRLPDFEVYEKVKALSKGEDNVLQYIINNMKLINKPLTKETKWHKKQ